MVRMAELQRSIAMELNKKLEGTYQLVLIEGVSCFWFIHVHTVDTGQYFWKDRPNAYSFLGQKVNYRISANSFRNCSFLNFSSCCLV